MDENKPDFPEQCVTARRISRAEYEDMVRAKNRNDFCEISGVFYEISCVGPNDYTEAARRALERDGFEILTDPFVVQTLVEHSNNLRRETDEMLQSVRRGVKKQVGTRKLDS